MTLVQELKAVIENCIDNKKEIALFPLGEIGLQAKLIMKEIYGIEPAYIFDNHILYFLRYPLLHDDEVIFCYFVLKLFLQLYSY